ncbi:glycosyltransferase [Cellulomonas composti]|uniref:GDP-mannose:glycolipid 4-beta-D-mannosyltransferase n=1 Tax=Cellulomonas composti TaxID=266130 RepID=A0A511JAE8_9CELL|nr:glycosyltransferase [Cellulomonas composti]GEL94970.1 GDP-mannose:glycolipid 4-beta-D-mannosyltransferase [Cellulomonas composti]
MAVTAQSRARSDVQPRLRVLQSFRTPRTTTNPYLVQLRDALGASADVRTFSWRAALLEPFDVLHVHWPEVVVERRSRVRHLAACVLFALAVRRASSRGRVLVRTVHNLAPHEEPDRASAAVLRSCDARTAWWIRLTDRTPVPDEARVTTVPHGDYVAWFADRPRAEVVPGTIAYVGLIRPYKGVEDLLDVVATMPDPGLRLVVAGSPADDETRRVLEQRAAADPRVVLDLRYLDDTALVERLTSAELVVLPYRRMHNSGALLLALSLGRPVLAPRTDVNTDLAHEVGERWVQQYDGDVSADAIRRALEAVRADPHPAPPDLSARTWPVVADGHLAAYRDALELARGRVAR